ncbi:hypothetical protein [Brucella haematophila]|uniref:Uncharacterized protein n=1 Tax=Brucella haematophila TaxID=419474 RepID=A0ABX1DK32_9HYPH|nr:hypothetical protein [Brucella haematophila]NKC03328.1 hypothetical protein [Brucella haematophila]TMV04999.1 hypothetical protein FGI60_02815 [Brucella haematophila]
MTELKPFLEDMLSMSTGPDGRTLQIHFCRPVTADDRKALMDAHNFAATRPEPAATGTGLVTVGGEYLDGHTWKPMPAGVTDFALRGFKTRALCDRSQADELLASEREKALFLKTAMEIAQTHCGMKDKTIASLEADNAALAARVKELDSECNELVAKCNEIIRQRDHALNTCAQMEEDKDALEAKLAAAEKEAAAWEANYKALDAQYARAVLGGKPS